MGHAQSHTTYSGRPGGSASRPYQGTRQYSIDVLA